jgi:hypothetical protein
MQFYADVSLQSCVKVFHVECNLGLMNTGSESIFWKTNRSRQCNEIYIYIYLSHENQMRTKRTNWMGFQIVAWKLRFMQCYLDLQCLTNLISSFDFQKDPVRALRMTTRQTLMEVWRYLSNFMNVFVD